MSKAKEKPRPTVKAGRPTSAEFVRMAGDFVYFCERTTIQTSDGPRVLGDCMAPWQREVLTAMAPSLLSVARGEKPVIGRFWIEGVKAWAKSMFIALANAWLGLFASVPVYAQTAAADRDQADEAGKHLRGLVYLNGWWRERLDVQQWKLVGSNFECDTIATDLAGSHGGRALLICIDELTAITRFEVVRNLLDNANKVGGIVLVCLNAGFEDSESFQLRQVAMSSPMWSTHIVTRPPPWVDPAAVEASAKINSAERQARLWAGVWSTGSGQGLDWEDIKACIKHRRDLSNSRDIDLRDWTWWGGVDIGIRKNFSSFCLIGLQSGKPNLRVAISKTWAPNPATREVSLAAIEQFILATHRRFPMRVCTLDFAQAGYLQQRLVSKGLRCENVSFGAKSLSDMASMIMGLVKCRTIEFNEEDTQLLQDLRRITIVETAWGMKVQSMVTADGSHCDAASAMIYACIPAHKLTARDEAASLLPSYATPELVDHRPRGVLLTPAPRTRWKSVLLGGGNDGWRPANW